MNMWIGIALIVAIGVLVMLPPKLDPAVRLKEWVEGLSKRDPHYRLPPAEPDELDIPEIGEDWFKRARLVRRRPTPMQDDRGIPVSETPGGKLFAILAKGQCPHCNAMPARFKA